MNAYTQNLDRNDANYAVLTPVSFLSRTAYTWPERTSVIHGSRRFTWRQTYDRSRRLASALAKRGIGEGDTVAVMAANTPEMIEAHFGVPMTGAVLNTLNTRLDAQTIAFMLEHGEAKVLLTDTEFAPTIRDALARLPPLKPLVIDIADTEGPRRTELLGEIDYEALARRRRSRFRVAASGRRVAGDLAQLHVGHDRQSQGRRLPPSRRVPERAVQHHRLGHAAASRVPVDAADVPLQRLVLPVDDGGRGRHQRLPAPRRGEGRSSMRSATMVSRITAARRSCTRCSSTRPTSGRPGSRTRCPGSSPPRRRPPR